MDQRTSPTRRSCRQYWNNLPDHRKTEILSPREWTTSTLLINLPQTRRRGGRHHLSDNKGDDEADDADVGEDSVSNNADDDNDANEEDHSYVTQPPSDNDANHDHNDPAPAQAKVQPLARDPWTTLQQHQALHLRRPPVHRLTG